MRRVRVDAAAHYRQLLRLGRDEFLAAAAPAALVRYRTAAEELATEVDGRSIAASTATIESELEDELLKHGVEVTLSYGRDLAVESDLEVFPLVKKPGASFPDRITIGRTGNNDVVINDTSISRLHAYIRRARDAWLIADGGSKNGSSLGGSRLEARKERPLPSRAILRLGEVDLTFYSADDLFGALGGS